jgi:hypothetical protein
MSSSDGSDYLSMADETSPADAVRQGISGVFLALFGGIIMLLSTAFDRLGDFLDIIAASRDFFRALLTSPIAVIDAGVSQTIYSLTAGEWAFFGPFTLPVAVGTVALSWMVWNRLDPEIPIVDDLLPWRGN